VWTDLAAIPVVRRSELPDGARIDDHKLVVGGADDTATAAVERWYRREARRRLLDVAEREADRLDIDFRSLAVRDQRTRWGSCSAAGNLSLNWRLLIAPAYVRTYVVVHELCHVRVPNHSKEFWRMLDAAAPDWHGASAWLRDHGRELRGYAVASVFDTAD
jgi:predicted metal-dependent hydrolase